VEFSDGTVAMRWLRRPFSVAFYGSIRDVLAIHGHGGRTQVKWLDYSDCIESLQRARQCAD